MTSTDECEGCFHIREDHYGGEDGSCMDVDSEGVECTCKWFEEPVEPPVMRSCERCGDDFERLTDGLCDRCAAYNNDRVIL